MSSKTKKTTASKPADDDKTETTTEEVEQATEPEAQEPPTETEPETEEVKQADGEQEGETDSLVGAGTPMVDVRANVGCLGMSFGQTATLVRTPEVEANIENGNVTVIEAEPVHEG